MRRALYSHLLAWKKSPFRKPLVLRGARQVGKSHLIETFGKQEFEHFVVVNFELEPELKNCFQTLKPPAILLQLSVLTGQVITPGKTLLFLDEVQFCPMALQALRYFKEELPALHIIAAGSLLEFVLGNDFSMPVGRVEYLYLYPMSFSEFLLALAEQPFLEYIQSIKISDAIPETIHQRGIELVRLYQMIGGMPEAVLRYTLTKDLGEVRKVHTQILNTYRDDFGKYGARVNVSLCETLFNKAANLVAKNFKYVDVDPDRQARDIKGALFALLKAGVFQCVYQVAANGIPLNSEINYKKFKLLFLDVGLIKHMGRLESEIVLQPDLLLIHQGRLTEQFVGQELLAAQEPDAPPELFYWQREQKNSQAEVDYVVQVHDIIIPIEVKSGKSGKLKSLQLFLIEKKKHLGVKISQDVFGSDGLILSVPLYMISELSRVVNV